MMRRVTRNPRTDYGTVALHACMVAALLVAILSGLRIASEAPDRTWINLLDPILPTRSVWTAHMKAAVALVAVTLAYAIYLRLAGLTRRVSLDRVRLFGLFGKPQARWSAISVALYWIFYAVLLTQIVTGGLLYFDCAAGVVRRLHWLGMSVILGFIGIHIAAHWKIGRVSQLLRVLRPMRLAPPPPPFDPMDVLAILDEPVAPSAQHRHRAPPPGPSVRPVDQPMSRADFISRLAGGRWPNPVVHFNPFVVAVAVTLVAVSFLVALERQSGDSLTIRHVSAGEVPTIDGDTSDPVWRIAPPTYVMTSQGGNFDGNAATTVEIRAAHDGEWAYFLFTWDDPTRSLKQLPLVKTSTGWTLLHDGFEQGDEHAYNEDKFSVLLTKLDVVLAGDRTFHAGATPAAGKPSTLSGRGLHYTEQDGLFVDVWQWKATSTGAAGYLDDDHFGPPVEQTKAQFERKVPYRGGFEPDPGTPSYFDNFELRPANSSGQGVIPRRLPKDVAATVAAMGLIDIDPGHSESEGARWSMTEEESTPYSRELNAAIPVGTVIPGVIVSDRHDGDRADVRCAARWAAGRWALEVTRRLDTQSPYDVPISTGTFMRVAAFDHSQIRHTRHVRPIRLEVE
jgi:hypothetical protein